MGLANLIFDATASPHNAIQNSAGEKGEYPISNSLRIRAALGEGDFALKPTPLF